MYSWDDTPLRYSLLSQINGHKHRTMQFTARPSCAIPQAERTSQSFTTQSDCEDNNYCWQVPTPPDANVPHCFDPVITGMLDTEFEVNY